MKRIIFLDTGYLIALIRKKDQFHAAAMEASELYPGPFLTTDLKGQLMTIVSQKKEENIMRRMFWICLLVFGLIVSWTLVCAADFYVIPTKKKNYAPVEKTGQTTSYLAGDDGDLEKGVAWPSPRFTDNGNGTVTDNLTGLIWLKNANCDGGKTWADALIYCNALASGSWGLTDGSVAHDWRLPNVNELQSLIHYGVCGPALPNTAGTGRWSEGDPFINVQSGLYWSGATPVGHTGDAWAVNMFEGGVSGHDAKSSSYPYVWPVRGGN